MKRLLSLLIVAIMGVVTPMLMAGCQREEPGEEIGEAIEEVGEEMGEAVEEVGEEVQELGDELD
jgi:hypothetical protein